MTASKILSIILPVFNPHENWEDRLCNSLENLTKLLSKIDFEIIIVNDGSTLIINDMMERITTQYKNVRFLTYSENKGKGHAIKFGVENSDSEYYIYTDFDFPFGYRSIFETFNLLQVNNCDLVFGKRNNSYFGALPLRRHILSKCLRTVNYIMLGFKRIDTQAGLKGFNKRIRKLLLDTKTNGFIFEFEFIRKCLKSNCRIVHVNLSISEDIRFSDFRFKTILKESWTYLKLLFFHE